MKKYILPLIFIGIGLQGCGSNEPEQKTETNPNGTISDATKSEEHYNLKIKQTAKDPDAYIIEEKTPSTTGTTAILTDMEGNQRLLSEEELKKLAEAEAKKVEEGTSNLAQTPQENSPGLSLGETILAGAAGALIGGLIASKLAGNSNFQQHQQVQQQQTSAYQQSQPATRRNSLSNSVNNNTRTTTTTPSNRSSGSIYDKANNNSSLSNRRTKRRR